MKKIIPVLFALMALQAKAQSPAQNIIIITTDGFRWHEIFTGMDSVIADNPKFNEGDSALIFKKYWDNDVQERRKKLMPFLWTTIEEKGRIYGNREYGNKVDNANPYWFSYPGYSEIMTGFVDTAINSNKYPPNPNSNVLEFLNKQQKFKGKVVAFTAWDAFNNILNEKRSGFPVFAGFDSAGGQRPDANEKLINALQADVFKPMGDEECLDVFTHYEALEYLRNKKPRVLYIAYGETDEWAHAGHYHAYLDAAHQVDAWIKQLWTLVQSDPQYKDKTAIFITTDHGRGDIEKEKWTSHNNKIQDAHEIWFAVMGAGIASGGEIKQVAQIYQRQYAQTFARILGYTFTATHPVADAIMDIFNSVK